MSKWNTEPQIIGKYIISIIKVSSDVKKTNQILRKVGLKKIEPLTWYPQSIFLRFFMQLQKAKGEDYLFEMGKLLIRQSDLPSNVSSFRSAVATLDLGYTIAHRNQVGAMFGQKSTTDLRLDIIAASPYPCPFDWGILQELVNIYASGCKLAHDFSTGCRLDGDHACRYTIDF
jgi:hypothetical protein